MNPLELKHITMGGSYRGVYGEGSLPFCNLYYCRKGLKIWKKTEGGILTDCSNDGYLDIMQIISKWGDLPIKMSRNAEKDPTTLSKMPDKERYRKEAFFTIGVQQGLQEVFEVIYLAGGFMMRPTFTNKYSPWNIFEEGNLKHYRRHLHSIDIVDITARHSDKNNRKYSDQLSFKGVIINGKRYDFQGEDPSRDIYQDINQLLSNWIDEYSLVENAVVNGGYNRVRRVPGELGGMRAQAIPISMDTKWLEESCKNSVRLNTARVLARLYQFLYDKVSSNDFLREYEIEETPQTDEEERQSLLLCLQTLATHEIPVVVKGRGGALKNAKESCMGRVYEIVPGKSWAISSDMAIINHLRTHSDFLKLKLNKASYEALGIEQANWNVLDMKDIKIETLEGYAVFQSRGYVPEHYIGVHFPASKQLHFLNPVDLSSVPGKVFRFWRENIEKNHSTMLYEMWRTDVKYCIRDANHGDICEGIINKLN